MGDMIGALLGNLMPIDAPARTSMNVPTINNGGGDFSATDSMTRSLIAAITQQGAAGYVPWSTEIDEDFDEIFPAGTMAYVDASEPGTTAEQLNDMIYEKWHAAMPWDDGSEQEYTQYMPIFRLKVDRRNCTPGFVPLATPATINQMQAQLLKVERDAKLAVAMGRGAAAKSGWRALLPVADPAAKMRRLIGGGSAFDRIRTALPDPVALSAKEKKIDSLRFYAATSANELLSKIDYAGPITQIWEGNGPRPRSSFGGTMGGRPNHRLISTSWHSRGKIVNMFTPNPREGDQIYMKGAHFSRESLSQMFIENGIAGGARVAGSKRGFGDDSYIITPKSSLRADTSDAFLQLRGFSSRDQHQYMGDSTGIDSLKPELADKLYVQRERRATLDWREYVYDPDTQEMRLRDLLGEEGFQEVRDNAVTDIVLRNYLTASFIIPMGTIKEKINRDVDETAILNAHYDNTACAQLPHFDIYMNH